ncbi:hypothetical protein D9757_010932 [Collybiopsis confluens]|uniref:protein-tyrosine-phosphatase n=1 Tax=Collybiopsis confluens TaxID=2823264 RepID=A0A8H5GJX2_9AGAR|nr:hypothetical protein D9757_010932 [Collybiopsis confluens]
MNAMDQVIPGLWIGGLPSALDTENLRVNKIHSVLSVMRGKLSVHETFIKHQILLDDSEDEDVLVHLLPAITFIQSELDKGRGVLVHCQAGISRSATIVAAYLMHNRHMNLEEALDLIRKARVEIDPNPSFLAQLEIFQDASFTVSPKDKTTRMYYLQRTTGEVMNGDGSLPSTDMFARLPRSTSDSTPPTPGGPLRGPRRRIRCKMCRQELAAREHMLDHGQLGPATPALTPPVSRRASTNQPHQPPSRRSSRPSSDSRPRRPSGLSIASSGDSLAMSSISSDTNATAEQGELNARPLKDAKFPHTATPSYRQFSNISLEAISMSALDSEDEDEDVLPDTAKQTMIHYYPGMSSTQVATHVGRRLSDAMITPATETTATSAADTTGVESSSASKSPASPLSSPNDLAAQLYANPKLAALRGGMPLSPIHAATQGSPSSNGASVGGGGAKPLPISPPILMNPKCSGYFVEPMQWMEPFLEAGEIAGKILCPNQKCGSKLGNYDWAGVCCGCKEWVVPGFCISRSKVDEIVA